MKKRKDMDSSELKLPERKRNNFVQVPAMAKPIPVPTVKPVQVEKTDTQQ